MRLYNAIVSLIEDHAAREAADWARAQADDED